MSEGTIVTFYSYKGGVGRTFALANIGALLSLWGYKTLCVDRDLEAPGLHLYFKSWLNKSNHSGLIELVQSHVEGEKPNWLNYVSKVNIPNARASLYLMSAGLQDKTYIHRMQALDWTKLYESHTLGNFLEELRENWKESLDFVLIDSRTGISDIGSICTVQLPDLLTLILTANDQSLYGSLDVLQRIEQVHANLPLDRAKLWVMPVVSRFEGRVEYTLAQEWLAIFAKALAPIYAEWAHKDVTASDLLNFTRIPYVPYWSFGEKLPVIEKGTEDPEDIGFLLETLASLVARKFSYSEVLIKNRDSYVAVAKRGPIEASVLISSTPSDHTFALRLKSDLEARGFTTRSTTHNEQKFDKANREDTLGQMIRTSQLILLIASPHTWPSHLVKEHLRIANMYERRLVFVWAAGDDRATLLPDDWGTIPALDLIDARQARYEIALDEIITRIEKEESIISPLELNLSLGEPRNPYKGLRAFTSYDAADFFGRDSLIEELMDRVRHILTLERPGMSTERLLSVIGPSGSGKSSVVMAGFLPRLHQGTLPGSHEWVYLEPMVPGSHPLETLALTLSMHLPDMSLKAIHEDLKDDSARGLHLLATKLAKRQGVKVVLLVDQFEELFTLTHTEDEMLHFFDLLITATTEPRGPVIVLITLRADYYDRPMRYPLLHQLIQSHQTNVLPMAIDDLRKVIEKPAELPDVRLTFEDGLVGDLLFEVQGQVGALPLLQFTLDQLFQRRNGYRLTLSAYRELGGVKGALTRLAEETYATLLSEEHRKLTRALFVRLIDPGASEQDTTRRRAALSEFSLADASQTRMLQEVADAFIAVRLLTTNEIAGTTTIEVSHEALIREWPRLADWLREARDDIFLQKTISEDVAEWEQRNKPGDRLYRGSQLKEAQAWARRNTPSGNEVAFLRASAAPRIRSIASVTVILLLLLSTTGLAGWFLTRPDPNHVTTLNDNGPGSLRQAIAVANPGSTITFDTSLRGTILLSSGDLNIAKNLTIHGPGAGILSISSGKSGYFIHVLPGITVTISGLTFKASTTPNGFIDNEGMLTLTNSTISGNTAATGGGISNSGTLTLTNSTVSGNTAATGGGINNQGTMTITSSTISGNTAAGGGGDISTGDVNGPSQLTISNSIVGGYLAHPGPDISGMLMSNGYNLFQDNSGATFDPTTRTKHSTDKTLSVNDLSRLFASPVMLRGNGGPTQTLALAPDSPAVDQIPLDACHTNGIASDQRGMKRPDGNEALCDIGAYEYQDSST